MSQVTFQIGANAGILPTINTNFNLFPIVPKYKLAVIFNTCGVNAYNEKVDLYVKAIENILNQDFDSFQVFVSSCLNSEGAIKKLKAAFDGRVNFNIIKELHPVNVTFNHTALKAYEWFGDFDGYLYVDSGVDFGSNRNVLKKLYELYKSGPYGMVGARPTTDSGIWHWFGLGNGHFDESGQEILFKEDHLLIPPGKTLNLHCQIFSKEIFHAMNKRIIPDIFASFCTESTFFYVNAAVRQKFIFHKDVVVSHRAGMDGPSSGFSNKGKTPWKHLYKSPKSIEQILSDPEAFESGFGYEELFGVFPHNKKAYDANNNNKYPERLKSFIKSNLYLPSSVLDYSKINSEVLFLPKNK